MRPIFGIVLGILSAGAAFAQRLPVTETEALSYVLSAFVSQVDSGVMRGRVTLGPELEKRLKLASGSEGVRVYQALVALTGERPLEVRKATPEEIAAYGRRRGFDPGTGHALYTLDAGSLKLLLQYDLQSARIPFVGELGVPDPDPRPVAVAEPAKPDPPAKPALLNLTWTGQFEYNSATLTPEARARLDGEIVPKLLEIGNIRYLNVSGHTDRIGSQEVNQRLSEKRAEAVRDHLVAKGVKAGTIEVFGYGKTLPVKSCPDDKKRSALIDCLAPNRRVVMEVQAAPR